jgi:hypothetical protein
MIRIDELHIRAQGRSEEDGRALAGHLTERLAQAIPEPTGKVHIPLIRVKLQSTSLEDPALMSERIAEQIIRNIKSESL